MTLPDWDRYTYDAVALDNHDGDTVRLRVDLGFGIRFDFATRLLGIQCPEVAGPNVSPEEQAAGMAAKDAMHKMLFAADGTPVPLSIETVKDRTEGRGRYLVTIYAGGTSLNDLMVASGNACAYDGQSKAPKWQSPGVWLTADGKVLHKP